MQFFINYLKTALTEAEKGRGFCAPNPTVGAVVVKNNQILAVGHHQGPGEPHAEVEAIAKLSDTDCEGAEIYVTLEPCCHYGRTPPCADLLIKKKFKAVYYGFQDPNPIVAGKGAEKIREAGIHCEHIDLEEINTFYRSYAYWTAHKKPFITAKIALSLDGKTGVSGAKKPVKLTSAAADKYTHLQRKNTDAILSTVKTVVADNPQLNARTADGNYQKKLFLIGGTSELFSSAAIFKTAQSITLFTDKTHKQSYSAINYVNITQDSKGLNLAEIINYLGNAGLHDVWVEAGATLLNNLLRQNLLNRLIIYVSPKILGNTALSGFFNEYALPEPSWQIMGDDVMVEFIFLLD